VRLIVSLDRRSPARQAAEWLLWAGSAAMLGYCLLVFWESWRVQAAGAEALESSLAETSLVAAGGAGWGGWRSSGWGCR